MHDFYCSIGVASFERQHRLLNPVVGMVCIRPPGSNALQLSGPLLPVAAFTLLGLSHDPYRYRLSHSTDIEQMRYGKSAVENALYPRACVRCYRSAEPLLELHIFLTGRSFEVTGGVFIQLFRFSSPKGQDLSRM